MLTTNLDFLHPELMDVVRLFAGEEHRTSVKKLSKGKRGTENM